LASRDKSATTPLWLSRPPAWTSLVVRYWVTSPTALLPLDYSRLAPLVGGVPSHEGLQGSSLVTGRRGAGLHQSSL
jgi:hypothetical protein